MRKGVFFLILASIQFSQIMYHNPIQVANSNNDLRIEAVIENGGTGVEQALIFFRRFSHFDFIHVEMEHEFGNIWSGTIPSGFLKDDILEYYITAEFYTGGIVSYPYFEPAENPLRIRIEHFLRPIQTIVKPTTPVRTSTSTQTLLSGEESNALVLSPEPDSFVLLNDIMIAVSLMAVESVDYSNISVKINNKDFSNDVNVQGDIVSIIPSGLGAGRYNLEMIIRDTNGKAYNPIKWSFFAVTSEIKTARGEFKQSGKIAADHTRAEIDREGFDISNLNMEWKGTWDFGQLKIKSKMTSLEDPLEQPRNRYSAKFSSPFVKLKLGDVNPYINEYAFNGYRIRGLNFELDTRFLDVSYVQGQVVRPIQGDPDFDAMFIDWDKSSLRTINEIVDSLGVVLDTTHYTITDFFSEINNSPETETSPGTFVFDDTDSLHFIFNRSDYEFEQDINAINLGFGNEESFLWNINVIKVKDNYSTVNNMVGNSTVWLPAHNSTNYYRDIHPDIDSIIVDTLIENYNFFERFINTDSTAFSPDKIYDVNVSEYFIEDTVNIIYDDEGNIIDYDIEYFLDTYVDSSFYYQFKFADFYHNYSNLFSDAQQFNYSILDKDWEGSNPQDNIVLGSDFKIALDNQKIRLNAGFAFSMFNQNIWDPVINKSDLDTLFDDDIDGYIGRTYHDNGGINTTGLELDEVRLNPERLSKYFHMNFNQLPLLPIDVSSGTPGINEMMTMPSLLYHYNLRLFYGGHSFNYAFRQVGPEFYSLVNPFIQKNVRERQISDRVGLFQNRLYLNYKWKNSIDGIDPTVENLMITNNHDFNINLYPGIGMPTFTFGMGSQDRNNEITEIDTIISELDTTITFNGEHTTTRKLNILMTGQMNLFGLHNLTFNIFDSRKKDYLSHTHTLVNPDYISQSSTNNSYSLNVKSRLSSVFETSSFINFNRYTLGEGESLQEQKVFLMDLSGIYKRGRSLRYVKNGFNFTKGSGSSEFSQLSYKFGFEYEIVEFMILRSNYELRYKSVAGGKSNINSMFILNLGYKF